MPFLRLSRDQRGYENTFLLHAARPGERPRVLYWYRSAPGVRVGRLALDEDAIRAIEEQHPDIEFDWPHIFEDANTLPAEIERRPERPRRKTTRPREQDEAAATSEAALPAPEPESRPEPQITHTLPPLQPQAATLTRSEPSVARSSLLDELVGREIAARLRARFDDIQSRLDQTETDDASRDAWQQRVRALNPDSWATPEAILDGVQRADRLFDELRREILVKE